MKRARTYTHTPHLEYLLYKMRSENATPPPPAFLEIGTFTKNIKLISSNIRYNDNNIKRKQPFRTEGRKPVPENLIPAAGYIWVQFRHSHERKSSFY